MKNDYTVKLELKAFTGKSVLNLSEKDALDLTHKWAVEFNCYVTFNPDTKVFLLRPNV
jgi:hypothetical protein